jgi:hypothetical protein
MKLNNCYPRSHSAVSDTYQIPNDLLCVASVSRRYYQTPFFQTITLKDESLLNSNT